FVKARFDVRRRPESNGSEEIDMITYVFSDRNAAAIYRAALLERFGIPSVIGTEATGHFSLDDVRRDPAIGFYVEAGRYIVTVADMRYEISKRDVETDP